MVDTTILHGADSTDHANLPSGLDFYCYYTDGQWPDATEALVKASFPGKKYVAISAVPGVVAGADVLDFESGAWTVAELQADLAKVKPVNLNIPGIYCSASNVPQLSGIPRDTYYLFQADWDGVSAVPGGADLAQYTDDPSKNYDLDVAYAYVFKPVVKAFPLDQKGTVHSFTTGGTADVVTTDGGKTWNYVG